MQIDLISYKRLLQKRGLGKTQIKPEATADPKCTDKLDLTAHHMSQLLRNGQTQSRSSIKSICTASALIKCLKNTLSIAFFYTDSLIF